MMKFLRKHDVFNRFFALLLSFLIWINLSTSSSTTLNNLGMYTASIEGASQLDKLSTPLHVYVDSEMMVEVTAEGTSTEMARLLTREAADRLVAYIDVKTFTQPYSGYFDILFKSEYEDIVFTAKPSRVFVRIDHEVTKNLEVRVEQAAGSVVSEGYILTSEETVTPDVFVTGPKYIIDQVSHARVMIDKLVIDKTIDSDFSFEIIDKSGNVMENVKHLEISPANGMIHLIKRVVVEKEVPLILDLAGTAGISKEDVDILIEPRTVVIVGEEQDVEEVESLSLGQLNINSIDIEYSERLPIELPAGIKTATGITEADVTIAMKNLIKQAFTCSNFRIINRHSSKTATVITEEVTVTLIGRYENLALVNSEDIILEIDLKNEEAAAGSHEYTARVDISGLPAGIGAVGGDYKVLVRIE